MTLNEKHTFMTNEITKLNAELFTYMMALEEGKKRLAGLMAALETIQMFQQEEQEKEQIGKE